MIDNLIIDYNNLKFVLSSTGYDDKYGDIVVAKITMMTPTTKHITVSIIELGSTLESNL